MNRITVKGKFLFDGEEKFYIKGVTYGTFEPDENGLQFPDLGMVDMDFTMLAANGINCVRTYTVPPVSLLDIAQKHNLRVMVGLPWEQHITFLDDQKNSADILNRLKHEVELSKGHPAILCYTIGNEIPAGIVRWHGKKKIETFLKRIFNTVKSVDAQSLVTYVNFPTTEYLELDFVDFNCFNVYLETPEKLRSYIQRLQNMSEEKPLVLAEIGLDSMRNGEDKQAEVLKWQVETIFASGCAGMFVFAWTDEWWRGGYQITDWDFGLVTRSREPKPALVSVVNAFKVIPVNLDEYPLVSVVVCSYNGSRTIRECLTEIGKIDYPNYEVIVVNDGSKDNLAEIVQEFWVKLISTPNRGLSQARNTGMLNAKGEIIAYIDDDAYPDPQWLKYLVHAYKNSEHGCIGGPNIAPDGDGLLATAVANAPGGPVHVLVSDEIAEHVPGCNMSFRREALLKIGGFDPVYTNAGDDVDVCWRIQQAGYTIGFHPSAVVWHHRRNSYKAYWKQQKGYGKAEALLEAKWPEKYNRFGHLAWHGRIYGNGITVPVNLKKEKVFHGVWGSALFQSVYQPAGNLLTALPLMPEWYLFTAFTAFTGMLGVIWPPLLWSFVLFGLCAGMVILQAFLSAKKTISPRVRKEGSFKLKSWIVLLHLVQPMARLYGRIDNGLTPWRTRGARFKSSFLFIFSKTFTHWSESWHSSEEWLTKMERSLIRQRARVKRGGEFDNWDLQTSTGLFSKYKSLLAIEEHGANKQYLRLKTKLHISMFAIVLGLILAALLVVSLLAAAWIVSAVSGFMLAVVITRFFIEKSAALNTVYHAWKHVQRTITNKGQEVHAAEQVRQDYTREPEEELLVLEMSNRRALFR